MNVELHQVQESSIDADKKNWAKQSPEETYRGILVSDLDISLDQDQE